MASTSTRFLMKVPDGTDTFDNDQHIKGNLNIIDQKAALITETVASQATGQRMEVVEISFTASGTTNEVSGNGSFSKAFTGIPNVMPAQVTQATAYANRIMYPSITSVTTTGFTVTLKTSYTGAALENFGAGTIKMKFVIFGS
jgi:hypothetical protein